MRNFRIVLFVAVSLFSIWWFGRPLVEMARRVDRIEGLQTEVDEVAKERDELLAQVEFYRGEEYVEQEARDRLNLSREGEQVLILPPSLLESAEPLQNEGAELAVPWEQWRDLFFSD